MGNPYKTPAKMISSDYTKQISSAVKEANKIAAEAERKIEYHNGAVVINNGRLLNFLLENRSTGKSYYWKRRAVKNFIEKGEMFMYIRRNKIDMDMSVPLFFDDIGHEFPNYTMETTGNTFILVKKDGDEIVKKPCGYFFNLAAGGRIKSMPLETVTLIIFDEFIPEDGKYLRPYDFGYEPRTILSIILTVARGYKKVIRDNVQCVCLANAVYEYNPYFAYFGIKLNKTGVFKNDKYYAHIKQNDSVAEAIKNSKVGSIIADTSYGGYAITNKPWSEHGHDIALPDKKAYPVFYLFVDEWYRCAVSGDSLYFSHGFDETFKRKYKCADTEMLDTPWFSGEPLKIAVSFYNKAKVFYDDQHTKAMISGILNHRR